MGTGWVHVVKSKMNLHSAKKFKIVGGSLPKSGKENLHLQGIGNTAVATTLYNKCIAKMTVNDFARIICCNILLGYLLIYLSVASGTVYDHL